MALELQKFPFLWATNIDYTCMSAFLDQSMMSFHQLSFHLEVLIRAAMSAKPSDDKCFLLTEPTHLPFVAL